MQVWRRRRAETPDRRAQDQAEAEVLAALEVVALHAEAGRRALCEVPGLGWAPPQMWSQPPVAAAPTPVDELAADQPATTELTTKEPAADEPPPQPLTFDIPAELLRIFDAVTAMCDHVIEYIEADRAERPLMIEALTRLNQSLGERTIAINNSGHPSTTGERVIGGSMDAGPPRRLPERARSEPVVDLRPPETAVEVRCRFGDRWVDGFEICEILHDELGIRYRLRRRVDNVVLPDLFGAADIRHIETFEELTSPAPRHWSPL